MKPSDFSRDWQRFYDGARNNEVLDERTPILLHLGAAMALGCYP